MSAPAGEPLRCLFLGYLWKVAAALDRSPATTLVAVGLEPRRTRSAEASARCEAAGIATLDAGRVRRDPTVARIVEAGLDLLVVGAFGQILPARLIEAPRLGTLNVHPSLLPAYRGGWPIEWQILRGERRGGVTVHWMVEEVDAGPVAAQEGVPITDDDDYAAVFERCHDAAARLLAGLLERPPADWPRRPQEGGDPPVPARSPADGVVDWSRPAEEIRRLVLAEGWREWVRTETATGNLVLERVEIEAAPPGARPGEVLRGGDRPAVACGSGALRLLSFRSAFPMTVGRLLPSTPREEG